MRYGYGRVSTEDQDLDVQLIALESAGCDEVFLEKVSGTLRNRPELDAMMAKLAEGDVVTVTKLDRMFRSTQDMLNTLAHFEEIGVQFECVDQPTLNTSDDSPMAKFFRQVIAAVAELERNLIAERTAAGREAAKKRGDHMGRPRKLKKEQRDHALELHAGGMETPEIARKLGVSRHTIWRLVRAAA